VEPPVLTITSPAPGATVPSVQVAVSGTIAAGGAEVAVVVNGIMARILDGTWIATDIPLIPEQENVLTATATTAWGGTATASVTVTSPPETTSPSLILDPSPASGPPPLTVSFALESALEKAITSVTLDFGDGTDPFTGASLDGVSHTYTVPGRYTARVAATDTAGTETIAGALISVGPRQNLALKWAGFKAALARGDIEGALSTVSVKIRERYRRALQALASDLPVIAAEMGEYQVTSFAEDYEGGMVVREERGEYRVYFIYFAPDRDGVWRIIGM
jgi:hypothetical protein